MRKNSLLKHAFPSGEQTGTNKHLENKLEI